jgi:hypothetical protein
MTGQDGRILRGPRRIALAVIATAIGVASLAAFAESYRALVTWAQHHELHGVYAVAFPLELDVFILVGEAALFVALLDGWSRRSRISAWLTTGAGLAASVAANVGHVAGDDWTSRLTAAVAPVAAAATLAVGLGVLKRTAADHAGRAAQAAVEAPEPAPTPVAPPIPDNPAPAIPAPSPAAIAAPVPELADAAPVLDAASLAGLDSSAKRARYAAQVMGTDSPAAISAALTAAGFPTDRAAARSGLRERGGQRASIHPLRKAASGE